jgi:hypothetical protein
VNKVEIEFKRIQTYLFASPRLRAMLGANAALGQTIRIGLPKIAKECGAKADDQIVEKMPKADKRDPLQSIVPHGDVDLVVDDPAALYQNYGVLVRDGGHFIATFPDPEQVRSFIKRATTWITESLPGILMEARLNGEKHTPAEKYAHAEMGESLFQHPGFQVSQYMGNRPAESRGAKGAFVSAEEKQMEDRGKNFRKNPSDLIALLESTRLIPCPEEPPQSLEDIVGDHYLALIHADGNSIGKRYQEWRKQSQEPDHSLGAEAHGERFYHSMRVAVRRALTEALRQVFANAPERYQLLMLGGDDLLMACAAPYALPFVHAYAEALERLPLCDGKPLGIGAGVAIAKHTFPFHRLHATAEALADSAKQRYRANPDIGSVVDWHVTSSAWLEDPMAERRADSLAGHAILSSKPYPVLGERSLDQLLKQAESIAQASQMARSQLRGLIEVMRQGPSLADLTWRELPDQMRNTLQKTLTLFDQSGPFRTLDDGLKISVLPDLVELYEINRQSQEKEHAA